MMLFICKSEKSGEGIMLFFRINADSVIKITNFKCESNSYGFLIGTVNLPRKSEY